MAIVSTKAAKKLKKPLHGGIKKTVLFRHKLVPEIYNERDAQIYKHLKEEAFAPARHSGTPAVRHLKEEGVARPDRRRSAAPRLEPQPQQPGDALCCALSFVVARAVLQPVAVRLLRVVPLQPEEGRGQPRAAPAARPDAPGPRPAVRDA